MAIWDKLFGQKQDDRDSNETIQQNISSAKAIMLDVRSQQEFDDGHLKDVVFIPITEVKELPKTASELAGLDKSKIIYCH